MAESEAKRAKTEPGPARIAVIGAAWWSQGWHLPQLQRNPDAEIAAIMQVSLALSVPLSVPLPFVYPSPSVCTSVSACGLLLCLSLCASHSHVRAIVQRSEQPRAAAFLNLTLETKTQLRERYKGVPMFSSCEEMIADEKVMANLDGVIICTAHACHADMGKKFLAAGKHVLMEKPMTVDVPEARDLAAEADKALQEQKLCFMVNNTANYRDKCFDARRLVEEGQLGDIHHVLCVMYSPLMFLFDDPANDGWVKATGTMLQSDGSGNGFGYGQLSHLLGWVLHVAGLDVEEVTAMTHRSEKSGADLTDAALIRCKGNISVSLSGGCSWPGNEHGDEATGKLFDIKIFGSKGVLMYALLRNPCVRPLFSWAARNSILGITVLTPMFRRRYGGDDKNVGSGRLELRKHDGSESYIDEGFLMENTGAAPPAGQTQPRCHALA